MFGLALRDTTLGIRDICALARAADDAGFASIWIPEVGSRDAIVLATLVGHHTKEANIATGVVPVFSRNPVSLSLAAAAAAEACGGRFILGLGTGHRHATEAWYGCRWDQPRRRLRETVEVVRRILSGERVTHEGVFRIDDFHLRTKPPEVPIALGVLTPESLRLGGEIADRVLLNWLPPEGLERAALLAREAAADAGRDIVVSAYVRVAVAETPDAEREARTALREHTYGYVGLAAYASALRDVGLGDVVEQIRAGNNRALDELTDAITCCGEASAVRERLEAFEKTVDEVVVYPVPFGDDRPASVLRTLRGLAP